VVDNKSVFSSHTSEVECIEGLLGQLIIVFNNIIIANCEKSKVR